MRVKRILNPAKDERVIAVNPEMRPEVGVDWRRRLHFYTGRSLSDVALTTEQTGRDGRLAMRGQMLSPGVVVGLEAALEQEASGAHYYHLVGGTGIAASGEDVVLPRGLRVDVRVTLVYLPAGLTGLGDHLSLRSSLGELIADGVDLPRAGVLVLQPVSAAFIGRFDPTDQCEIDPTNDAFDDWQLADACRLVLYIWPTSRLPLPAAAPAATWRNRLAYTIFNAEASHRPDQGLPWDELGVPVGLVGFADDWTPLFLDRYAVVRAGGKPRRRPSLLPGNAFLWQARVQQLSDHIAEATHDNVPFEELSQAFRFLAPAGLLPREVINPREGETTDLFFPPDYVVDAVPIPLEQLDAAIEGSAALDPFDMTVPDRVRVLVPVPQVWYERALLQVETISPEFQQAIDEFVTRRGRWLNRREMVRAIVSAIAKAMTGEALTYASPDPGALETPETLADPIDPDDEQLKDPEQAYGTVVVSGVRQVTLIEELRAYLTTSTPLRSAARVAFPDAVADEFFPDLRFVREANEQGFLIYTGLMDEQAREKLRERLKQRFPNSNVNLDAVVDGLYAQSQRNEVLQLDRLGLIQFIDYLKAKLQQADDRIDLGFLQTQTNIYRLRQLMLGTPAASRLATSTALAGIAQGDTAAATREQLKAYADTLKATPSTSVRATGQASEATARGIPQSSPFVVGKSAPISELHSTSGFSISLPAREEIQPFSGGRRTDVIQQAAVSTGKLFQPAVPEVDPVEAITGQSHVVGKTFDFRTVTIAERLLNPPSNETKVASSAGKYEVINTLAGLDLNLDDVEVPGLAQLNDDGQPMYDATNGRPLRQSKRFVDLTANDFRFVLNDPDPRDADEAAFFSASVDIAEHTINTLRQIEGRVRSYKAAVARCEETLKKLQALTGEVDHRLKIIGDELAEARHDVAVARALMAEEQTRLEAINQRRTRIVAEQVPFLAYYRPRLNDLLADVPQRPVHPGLAPAPLPACLSRAVTIPPDLRAMVDLLSEVPLKWLTHVAPLLDRLNRIDLLQQTLLSAKKRAQSKVVATPQALLANTTSGLGQSLNKVFMAQHTVVTQYRTHTAQLNLASLVHQSWKSTRDSALGNLSLGDLRDAPHGRTDVINEATTELDTIAHVAGCLYESFGDVTPRIRLDWAERLSQYDAAVSLRNLANLPRWGEIAYLDRREMQGLVDWLYSRVEPTVADAVAMCDDLVRVAILLASHAPVREIIAGNVHEAATVQPGSSIKLNVDLAKVHIGMGVFVYKGTQVVAQAVVEDLTAGQAAAKVIKTHAPTVQLEKSAAVQFTNQPALLTTFGLQRK
jgi:hypothetical protein